MSEKKAVILLSGGIDSATTLAVAKSSGFLLYAISFDYNQRHRRELDSAKMVADALGVQRHLVVRFDLGVIGGSALTSGIDVPKNREQGSVKERGIDTEPLTIPVTYVPARNTIFLSFGLAWAEVLEAADIFIGANVVDYSGYPDCRPRYLNAFEDMANLATKASVEKRLRFRIRAPLIELKKSDIIRKGILLGLDYSLTWSCYDPQPSPAGAKAGFTPCGRCDSCVIRRTGFEEAGMQDPLCRI
jgi:7-cyano-7-deazaguanine synthase